MRAITKRTEPRSLTTYRRTAGANYNNYRDKDDLRGSLHTEQNGLCCYCMATIENGPRTMKIEHWKSQTRYPNEQLNYRNLLGACMGGEGSPEELHHCDTRKGDDDLKWNPANPAHVIETRISYEPDGSIHSQDPDFDSQLDRVLNLNLASLKNRRKSVLDSVLYWWKHEKTRLKGPVPRDFIERERIRRSQSITPFCQVAVWWIDQRLARMAKQ